MDFQITKEIIASLCGQTSLKRGEAYYRRKQVTFTQYNPETRSYKATVIGNSNFDVTVEIGPNGDVNAECSCPTLDSYDYYCQHIAAALVNIHHIQLADVSAIRSVASNRQPVDKFLGHGKPQSVFSTVIPPGVSEGDIQLTNDMLGLFSEKQLRPSSTRPLFDTRTPIEVEFTCRPFPYGHGKYMLGIEMKIGLKRLHFVQKFREFLDRVERRQVYVFSKGFMYDPELHSFQKENDAVIQQLIQIYHNEKMYSETSNMYSVDANSICGDRTLLIPPLAWDTLLPLLSKAPSVRVKQDDSTFHGISVSEEPPPLHFEVDQTRAGVYQLNIYGLEDIVVMESYGVVLSEGKLLRLRADQCKRVSELKRIIGTSHKHQIQIASEQLEPFMEKVIPGLMRLGNVRITEAVSNRIMQTPLKAMLYLDRIKDRLLAAVEFQYGDIVINPLEGHDQKRGTANILIRDGERERRILDLMEQSSFAKTESGYFMDDEEAEYDFLYHVVPQLQKLMQVYATSAVKVRLHTSHAAPKITVNKSERTDWLEFRFDMDGIPESQIQNVLKSLEEKRKYYRLPNGALLPLESTEFQEVMNFINEMGIRSGDVMGTQARIPVVRGLHLIDSQSEGNTIKLGKSFRQLLEDIRNPDNLEFPVPVSLDPILREYQKYGFQWLKTLAHYRFGGILADEMGLGKTLQTIAFIVSVLPEIRNRQQPAIIVSPASLLYNWRNELKRFAPEIQAVIADGSRAERSSILNDAAHVDVIITSYPLLRRDIDLYGAQSFHTFVLDEAQVIKNHFTRTAQAVKNIQAQHRFALTGTPVENTLEELWSIFYVVFPQLLPDKKEFNGLSRKNVAKQVRPFLLRRLKTDVLTELPEKIESLEYSQLLPEQKKLYVAYLAKLRQETVKHLTQDTFHKNRIKILSGLTRLRQLCCHPSLFVEGYNGSSAKYEQLMEIVEDCRSAGKRMLVFSQFTQMLGLIGRELGYQGVPYFYLDGDTPASERVELCNRFNEGERDLFLISLKAGGTGLNLTGADTVILYDLWWNPAVEEQAADRAHRIGQKNVVQVIRLITQGTVEEKMYQLQQKKKNLVDEVIQPGQEALSNLTEQEIRDILMI